MVPPALFRTRPVAAAIGVGAVLNFGLYGLLFVGSLFFQRALGYSATATGLAFLPLTLAVAVAVVQSGRMTARVGPRRPMLGGLAAATAGALVLLAVGMPAGGGAGYGLGTVLGFVLFGAGVATTMPAMTAVVIAGAPPGQAGIASGVLSASRQVGGVFGVVVLGALLIGGGTPTAGLRAGLWLVAGLLALGAAASAAAVRAHDAATA